MTGKKHFRSDLLPKVCGEPLTQARLMALYDLSRREAVRFHQQNAGLDFSGDVAVRTACAAASAG